MGQTGRPFWPAPGALTAFRSLFGGVAGTSCTCTHVGENLGSGSRFGSGALACGAAHGRLQ
jgi:hypothetical protein